MRAVLLMSVLALVAAHRENCMIQQVEQRQLVSCVVSVVQRYFPVGRTIQLSSTPYDDHTKSVLEAIHRLELWPVQLSAPNRVSVSPPNMEKISSYIIFIRSVKDIRVQAEMLYDKSSWDGRGLFLIVVTIRVFDSEELALSLIRELWQIGRVYNVVVVVQQDDLLKLYTWFPFSSHDKCAEVKNVVLINQWVMEGEGKFVSEGLLYPCKIPSNFHGCTVNLSTFWMGVNEEELFSQYFLSHNITKNHVSDIPYNVTRLEIFEIFMQNLWVRESDMAFGWLALEPKEVYKAEYTFPYFPLQFNWFVPCPKPLSRLQKVSHIFSPTVWVAIVVVLFLFTVASWCLAKQSNDIPSYTTMSSALYNIWAVTVGVSVTGKPRSLRLKLLFVVFVWYCSAISTVFQTFLTSFLVDPGYENPLTSLDEILDSGIEFGYHNSLKNSFVVSSDLRDKEIVERAEMCFTEWECIDRIRDTGNFATFVPSFFVQFHKIFNHDHKIICPINDNDYAFRFITTYVQKDSLFLESLNKFIILSIESGMVDKAFRYNAFLSEFTRHTTDLSDGYFVFTLSHLRVAFCILFFGHGLSFLLFLWEVFYHFRLRCV